jgi:phenylacetate-CoA ligase
MMAFSFGPFIGFWTANDALVRRGAMVIPGGGMSSEARLKMIAVHRCTIVCCTPTYALHLASVAAQRGVDLANNSVTRIIVAGEPGGSLPAVRRRIEAAWGARVIDHSGASEIGAWGFGSVDGKGLHVIETEFIAELLQFDAEHSRGKPAADGQPAELVLTNLGRLGGPAIRYRTGDIVRGHRTHDYDCTFLWLEGGVLGRGDDMMVIRGVNIFPSSVEAIIREVDATAEFRLIATRIDEMDQLAIEAELSPSDAATLTDLLRERLAMRINVDIVPLGTLPRFEAKAKRLIDRRSE